MVISDRIGVVVRPSPKFRPEALGGIKINIYFLNHETSTTNQEEALPTYVDSMGRYENVSKL